MKILFIGGTGNISAACSRLALQQGYELWLLHRNALSVGHSFQGAHEICVDIHNEKAVHDAVQGHHFDVVVNWIAFTPDHVERDLRLFALHTAQYVFISSASAYQKPPQHAIITENTPLVNPYWQYSRDKIACEALLQKAMGQGTPITIVRPSLTYDTVIPVPIGGWTEFTIIDRMRKGLPIVVHGDGTTPWTITHSEDFARGFVPLLGHHKAIGECFHITSDEHPTWVQIHEWLAEAAGATAQIKLCSIDDIVHLFPEMEGTLLGDKAWPAIFDNSKLRQIVPDYKAQIPFSEGIRKTVKWFDAEQSRQNINDGSNRCFERLLNGY